MGSCFAEIKRKLFAVLPENANSEIDMPEIKKLTREFIELIKEASFFDCTHSLCHIMSPGSYSFLTSPKLYPLAKELIDKTYRETNSRNTPQFRAKHTWQSDEYINHELIMGHIDRIAPGLIAINLTNMEETPRGFTIKPSVFEEPHFIEEAKKKYQELTWPIESYMELFAYLGDFCESKSMEEFWPKYVNNFLRKDFGLKPIEIDNHTTQGIFTDGLEDRTTGLEKYALMQMQQGRTITILTDPKNRIQSPVHNKQPEHLIKRQPVSNYHGKKLEIYIGKIAPAIQGFRAQKHYQFVEQALNAL